MKKDLHPEMKKLTVTCDTCGSSFETNSTKDEIKVDACNNCHPFYTGKATSASKAGRVDRFNTRLNKANEK